MEGAEYLFWYPANTLIEACAIAVMQPIMSRIERPAVNMENAYTRITNGRRAGVVVTQVGPGIENTFAGVAHAWSKSTPILALPGGTARNRLGQSPDFDAMHAYRDVTKWVAQIYQADRIPQLIRRGFTSLRSGQPGPLMLLPPDEVATEEIAEADFDYRPVKG